MRMNPNVILVAKTTLKKYMNKSTVFFVALCSRFELIVAPSGVDEALRRNVCFKIKF